MEMNPYATSQVDVMPATQATTEEEMVRKQHLNAETTIKTVGFLYYLSSMVIIVSAISMLTNARHGDELMNGGFCLLLVALAVGQGATAYGLRRLRSWARIPTIVFSCLGLLQFPIGTIINGYILAVVASKKGKTVMTADYQKIISLTPHLRRKTSVFVWVLLVLLLLVLAGTITMAIRSSS